MSKPAEKAVESLRFYFYRWKGMSLVATPLPSFDLRLQKACGLMQQGHASTLQVPPIGCINILKA